MPLFGNGVNTGVDAWITTIPPSPSPLEGSIDVMIRPCTATPTFGMSADPFMSQSAGVNAEGGLTYLPPPGNVYFV